MRFEYPFIYCNNFIVKPVLVIFLVILLILLIFGIRNKQYCSKLNNDKKNKIVIKKIVIYICVYIISILVCYNSTILNFESNVIISIANFYLNYEIMISWAVLIGYLTGVFVIQVNANTFINFLNRLSLIIINTSLFFSIITRQILLTRENCLILFITIIVSVLLFVCKFEKKVKFSNNNQISYYEACKRYDNLFETNKKYAKQIESIILLQKDESISICISGKWGSGKTSVINGAIDLIEKNNTGNLIIKINALEIDSFDGLFKYFYDNVKTYLQEKGVYTGLESEYQNFITSCIGNITNSNIAGLLNSKLFNNHENYRDNKNELDKLLSATLNDERVVVIVDDIERCHIDKIKQFIFFVKEIATFSKCISIFATDYDILSQMIDDQYGSKDFFDKFFNYRINVADSNRDEMVKFYNNYIIVNDSISNVLQFRVEDTIKFIENNFEKQIQDEKSKEDSKGNVAILENRLKEFNLSLNNPRKMVKLFYAYSNYIEILKKEYEELKSDSIIKNYLDKIQLEKVLFLLSYIEVCLPNIYVQIHNKGIYNYLEEIQARIYSKGLYADHYALGNEEGIFISISPKILLKLSTVTLDYTYLYYETHKFVDCILRNHDDLKNIVNGFTAIEDEYYNAIENDTLSNYNEEKLQDIAYRVIHNFSHTDIDQGQKFLQKVFSHMCSRDMAINFVFENEFVNVLSGDLCVMKIIYNIYFKYYNEKNIDINLINNIQTFSNQYGYRRFTTMYNLIDFFNSNEDVNMNSRYIHLWHSNESFENKIIEYLNKSSNIAFCYNIDDNIINNLNNYVNVFEQKVIDNEFGEYPDFKDHIMRMRNSAEDICFFLRIQNLLSNEFVLTKVRTSSDINQENIDDWILYLNEVLIDGKITDLFKDDVSNFFEKINGNEDIDLTNDQIKKLQEFLSKYYKISSEDIMYYRGILFDMSSI